MTSFPETRRPTISLVIPCFNEADGLTAMIAELFQRLRKSFGSELENFEIILIDDGSSDSTWDLIQESSQSGQPVCGIRFLKNFGQQAALLCGYYYARGDWILTLDADLQDPPELLPKMLQLARGGSDIVVGRRSSRETDTPLKRLTAIIFYWGMQALGMPRAAMQAGDFRLMSRSAARALLQASRPPLFHRLKIFELGFPVEFINYERQPRFRGTTKYSFAKMSWLAWQAVWSSTRSIGRMAKLLCLIQIVLFALALLALRVSAWGVSIAVGLISLQVALISSFVSLAVAYALGRTEGLSSFRVKEVCGTENFAAEELPENSPCT